MYFVRYGHDYLHDPRADLLLTSTKLEVEVNAAGSFEFKMYSGHPLFDAIKERDTANPVTVYQDDALIFCGDILSIESDFHLGKKVTCRGELGWLNDSLVRPYSTLPDECDNVAPTSVDGYFEWLIENHNRQVEAAKCFKVGKNEGSLLDDNNYIYRSDSSYPNTGAVIKEKLLESLGGYVQVRHEDGVRYIDLLTDFPKVNAQIIDFGVNLLDYVKTDTTDDMATFVIPVGKEIEDEATDKVKQRLTVSSLADGCIGGDYFKSGDIIYSDSAVKERGWIGALVEFSDVTEVENLRDKGVLALKGLISPVRTVEVTAIDLAMIDPEYEPIFIGQYIRARSKPHDFDSYMLCSKIEFDLNQPDNDKFTLGTTFDVLTGVQNKRINALNATINTVYEAADQISAESKAAAVLANQAQKKAESAAASATEAVQTAIDADAKALAAQASVEKVETTVTTMQTTVTNAQSKAEAAEQAASQADSKAQEAYEAAQSATDTANAAQTASREASAIAAAAKLDAEQAQKDIAALDEELETVSTTMTANYARKTELTEATASLQSQISQNAGEISSTVTKLTKIDETANDAKDKAEAAQADVDALAVRVTTAETNITQNTEAIELRATKTEVAQTLGGYYTKSETEAKITETAESITSTVSSTYATKQEVDDIEVGGRNLAVYTSSEWVQTEVYQWSGGLGYYVNGSDRTGALVSFGEIDLNIGDDFTIAIDLNSINKPIKLRVDLYRGSTIGENYNSYGTETVEVGTSKRVVYTNTVTEEFPYFAIYIGNGDTTDETVTIEQYKCLKIEKGNKATAWTPAPEDVDGEVTRAFSEITQLSNSIQNLVVGKDGTSLMTQTDTGWTFNVGNMEETLETTSSALDSLQKAVGEWDTAGTMASNIAALISIVNSHGTTLDWVNIGTFADDDGDELPCIELGESDSDYKLLITNKAIFFKEGSTAPTKIQDNTLVTNNVEVKHELKQGNWVWSVRSNGNLGLSWKEV